MSVKGTPGARIEQEINNNGWVACVQETGWFDTRVGQIWIEKILAPYIGNAEKSFLLVDHFSAHLKSDFVNGVNDLGCDIDFIPAGYTCVLQPVDVGVNATFKKSVRNFHHGWCLETYPKILDKDKFPTPERDDIYDWVIRSFNEVASKTIRKTYVHIGYIEKDVFGNEEEDDGEEERVFDNGLDNVVEVDEFDELLSDDDDDLSMLESTETMTDDDE